jgi:hypothetical protein
MKKYLFLILALSILFIGCEKEGVYNPNKKIKRIYEESLSGSSPKRLSQEWTWEKKQLKKIDYYSDNQISYTENFSYDNKNRLIRIEDYSYGERYEIKYDKDGVSKIELYIDNELYQIMNFKYDRNKIVEISVTVIEIDNSKILVSKSNKPESFISMILPIKEVKDRIRSKNTKGNYVKYFEFEYDGNNLSKMKEIDGSWIDEYTYENYDKKSNPFYSNVYSISEGFSKNNVGKVINRWETREYEYTYDGKFPTEVTMKYTGSGGSTSVYRTYYEYE